MIRYTIQLKIYILNNLSGISTKNKIKFIVQFLVKLQLSSVTLLMLLYTTNNAISRLIIILK
jgi:hypothetical protein